MHPFVLLNYMSVFLIVSTPIKQTNSQEKESNLDFSKWNEQALFELRVETQKPSSKLEVSVRSC